MKKIILLICLSFAIISLKAQKKQNVYFFKNNGKEVSLKDSADYIRVIQEPDSGETNFVLQEYYANGKRKTAGKLSAFVPNLVYEGVVLRNDNAGKRKEITTYINGMAIGMSYHYFNNGKMHKQLEYLPYTPTIAPVATPIVGAPGSLFNPNTKLIYLADSAGVEYVVNGNGYVKNKQVFDKVEEFEEGSYKDGFKHGVWKGNETGNNSSFAETYEQGKLINGESIKDGITYAYTTAFEPPQYKGGVQKFYEYVGYSIRYPSEAARNNITGTVHLTFTIEKTGQITDVEVKKSVHPSLDDEAKRIVKFSPKWAPGSIRGIPVRVRYNIPVKFHIGR